MNERFTIDPVHRYICVQSANGTATSIKIIQNELNRSPQYIQYLIASKWNGQLPAVTSGGIPLLNIPMSTGNQTK
jgi:hypothetical protein